MSSKNHERLHCGLDVVFEKQINYNPMCPHVKPHIFSGWNGLLDREGCEAEGGCGGGGRWEKKRIRRNQEEGVVIVVHLLTTASRIHTMHLNGSVCVANLSKLWSILQTQDNEHILADFKMF